MCLKAQPVRILQNPSVTEVTTLGTNRNPTGFMLSWSSTLLFPGHLNPTYKFTLRSDIFMNRSSRTSQADQEPVQYQ